MATSDYAEAGLDRLSQSYLTLARNWSLWDMPLPEALQSVCATVSQTLEVARAGIWQLAEDQQRLILYCQYDQRSRDFHSGVELRVEDHPQYFAGIRQHRVVDVADAVNDTRTRSFTEHYLQPNDIGALLDIALRAGSQQQWGVLCLEHVGGTRHWSQAERWYASSVADLVAQIITHQNGVARQRELSFLLENIPIGILRLGLDGRGRYVNPTLCSLLGLSSQAILRGAWLQRLEAPDRQFIAELLSPNAQPLLPISRDCRLSRGAEGGALSLSLRLHKEQDHTGHPTGMLLTFTDVTVQRQVIAELIELSGEQQAILDNTNQCIIATNREGIIQLFNRAAQNQLGYSAEEVVGRQTPLVFHDTDELIDAAKLLSRQLGRSVRPDLELFTEGFLLDGWRAREWTFLRKDGSRFPGELACTPLRNPDGSVRGYMATLTDTTQRHQSEAAALERLHHLQLVEDSEARYHALFEGSNDAVIVTRDDRLIDCNRRAQEMFGGARDQLIGLEPLQLAPERQPSGELSAEAVTRLYLAMAKGESQRFEWLAQRLDGECFDADIAFSRVDLVGTSHVVVTVRDITDRKQAERDALAATHKLAARNASLRWINDASLRLHDLQDAHAIAEAAVALLRVHNSHPMVSFWSAEPDGLYYRLAAIDGFEGMDPGLRRPGALFPKGGMTDAAIAAGDVLVCRNLADWPELSATVREGIIANGLSEWIYIVLRFHDEVLGMINLGYRASHRLVPEEIDTMRAFARIVAAALHGAQQLAGLEYQANHDALTGLPNRTMLHKVFAECCEQGPLALLLLDLDHFKEINDTLGHHIGDRLLREVGPRLYQPLQAEDFVCRLGGDEFAILLRGERTQEEVSQLAKQLLFAITQPFDIDGTRLEVGGSIGIAFHPEHGLDSHALLRSADIAMYRAKNTQIGVAAYTPTQDTSTPQRLVLMSELGTALHQRQFCLHFQPQLQLAEHRISGVEALVRWRHPQRGLLYPSHFIALAEMGESMHGLTVQVLDMALDQQKRWEAEGLFLTVSVNLSARSLMDDRCIETLLAMLVDKQITAGKLELEITETALMHDPRRAVTLLNRIAERGVKLSIDDFGVGYASLDYLRRLPVNALKIDRSFIKNMLVNSADATIVNATIQLAHNLGLEVIAEGVESQTTLERLESMTCDAVQGYHIGRPLPAAELRLAAP